MECTANLSDVDEPHPLLSQPTPDPQPEATCFSLLVILCITILLSSLFYFIIGPSNAVDYKYLYQVATARIEGLTAQNLALGKEVTLYKDMYEDVHVQAVHLEQENAALKGETDHLQTRLHDLREQLTHYKDMYEDVCERAVLLEQENAALEGEVHDLKTNLHNVQEQLTLYKDMYEDVRVRTVHLEQENSALEGEVHNLQTKLHDVREHLTNAKVLAFWEIARIMHTNTYVPRSPPLTQLMARSQGCLGRGRRSRWWAKVLVIRHHQWTVQ
jgi:predicted nuclease with TOPRIM domain